MAEEDQNAYDAVLADLYKRRETIDTAIAAIEALKTGVLPGGAVPSAQRAESGTTPKIKADEFFGMTILEAAKKYLGMMKRPPSSNDITAALQSGGYLFNAAIPVQTVASILNRDDVKGGDTVRVGKGMFGLAAWYPNRPRRRRQNGDEQTGVDTSSDADSSPESDEPKSEAQNMAT